MSSLVYVKRLLLGISQNQKTLMVHLSGCRLGCKRVLPDCLYNCMSNPGKALQIQEIIEKAKAEGATQIEPVGTHHQKEEFYKKYLQYK